MEDKSDLIREWWESGDAVTLITRPRRFGKTLNLDMLNCFFSNRYEGRGDLFEGLSIWKDGKYRRLQGSCPVIFLTFADIKGETFEETKLGIKHALAKLYETHKYVRSGTDMGEKEREFVDSVSFRMPDDIAVLVLKYLSDYQSRFYGKHVLVFLDEYDTPLQEAYVYGYWKELAVITTTSEKYCTQFGFTEEEVFDALDYFEMPEKKEPVKKWYDGFTFGSQRDVYNP